MPTVSKFIVTKWPERLDNDLPKYDTREDAEAALELIPEGQQPEFTIQEVKENVSE